MLSVLHQCQISTSRLTHLESAVYHRSQSDEVFSFYIPTAFERILPYWSSASRVFYMMIGFNCFLCQVVAFNDTPSVHLSVFLSVCCFFTEDYWFCELDSGTGGWDSRGSICGFSDEPGCSTLLLSLQQVWTLLQSEEKGLRSGAEVREQTTERLVSGRG